MVLLSLFCGAGGLDKGFEDAGFEVGLAYDKREPAIRSYNANRVSPPVGRVQDISALKLSDIDKHFGREFRPSGVIGGPPCQSFSRANSGRSLDDPRAKLVGTFVDLCLALHARSPLDFIVMENVPELIDADDSQLLAKEIRRLEEAGFGVRVEVLDAADYGVPQRRRRMFMVGLNRERYSEMWRRPPATSQEPKNVGDVLEGLPEPARFTRGMAVPKHHPNHWCMTPKSPRFFNGTLKPGYSAGRSFKTLHWDRPSLAVSYGNREVHVHPSGQRRLSVFEAMLLQGFPDDYVLTGTLSSQITQVSEAVPPPLAYAVAASLPVSKGDGYAPANWSYDASISA